MALLKAGINLPLSGIRDIRNGLSLAKMGAILSPGQLLEIASTLRTSRLVKPWRKKSWRA